MLKNYMTVAFRNLKKNKIYSLISVFGLTAGLACSIILSMKDPMKYDIKIFVLK